MRWISWYEWIYAINIWWEVKNIKTWRVLKNSKNSYGYNRVCLSIDGKQKIHYIHKLLMDAFVWNANWLQVNHKDWNKLNNNLDNLEYVTPKENIRHAWDNNLCISRKWEQHHFYWIRGKYNQNSKNIARFTKNWKYIDMFYSLKEASDNLKINAWGIGRVCNWFAKSAGWFIFKHI